MLSSISGVLDVRSDSDVVLRFDKAVSVSDGWFTVSCDDGEGGSTAVMEQVTTPSENECGVYDRCAV